MAVNEDIRIKIDLFNHPKFQELEEEHGAGVCLRLFQLWGAVARFKPDGILTGWTVRTIARQAGVGTSIIDAESLVIALVDSGFLDFDGETYSCHDWVDHQPWAAGVKDRETWAREMNRKKIEKRRRLQLAKIEQTDTGTGTGTGTEADTGTGTETDTGTGTATDTPHHLTNSLPAPNPKPNPKPAPKPTQNAPDEITQVIDAYREILEPVGFLPLNRVYNSDRTAIRAALGLGCGEEPRSASELREYFVSLKARAGDSSLLKSGKVGLRTILKPENMRDLENGAWADIDRSKDKPKNQPEKIYELIETERGLCLN